MSIEYKALGRTNYIEEDRLVMHMAGSKKGTLSIQTSDGKLRPASDVELASCLGHVPELEAAFALFGVTFGKSAPKEKSGPPRKRPAKAK